MIRRCERAWHRDGVAGVERVAAGAILLGHNRIHRVLTENGRVVAYLAFSRTIFGPVHAYFPDGRRQTWRNLPHFQLELISALERELTSPVARYV